MRRFRHRRSLRYQHISPLHRKFHAPLPHSSRPVSAAVLRLSRRISPPTKPAAYAPFKPSESEQRSHGLSYRGCWHKLSPCFLWRLVNHAGEPAWTSSRLTAVYNPKAFLPHAASLGQACAHCRRFSTAATRRCLGSVSVPVVGAMLSHPLGISGLVGRYLTNYLVPRKPLSGRNLTFC